MPHDKNNRQIEVGDIVAGVFVDGVTKMGVVILLRTGQACSGDAHLICKKAGKVILSPTQYDNQAFDADKVVVVDW